MSNRNIALLCICSVLLALATALIGPRWLGTGARPKFAVVDVAGIVRKHQERTVQLMADPASEPGAKKAAVAAASEFGKLLNAEVLRLSEECACILLLREAVVSGQIEDLTAALGERMRVRQDLPVERYQDPLRDQRNVSK